MKKMILFSALLFFAASAHAEKENLYERFKDCPIINVFLRSIVEDTGNADVNLSVFKDIFKEVIESRLDLNFKLVNMEDEADVIVDSRIREYAFQEKAPPVRAVPILMIPLVAVADTAEPKSAAKLVVDYEVKCPKTDRLLYEYKRLTTEARKLQEEMKGEDGYVWGLRENINRFVFRAFYKRGNR